MLKIKPPNYKFCPFCGKKLTEKVVEGKARKYCATDNWVYYPDTSTAAVAIITNKNKVLLVKRAREPYKGTFMFPAGFVDFGEHPEETLRREVGEETGLRVTETELLQVKQSTDDPRAPGHLIFVYLVKVKGSLKNKDKDENEDIGWFDINNPPRIGWKQHQRLMKKLQQGKN